MFHFIEDVLPRRFRVVLYFGDFKGFYLWRMPLWAGAGGPADMDLVVKFEFIYNYAVGGSHARVICPPSRHGTVRNADQYRERGTSNM